MFAVDSWPTEIPKPPVVTANGTNLPQQYEPVYTQKFRGYQIVTRRNRIEWSKDGRKELPEGYVDLPTLDSCEHLFISVSTHYHNDIFYAEPKLIWMGGHEEWEIQYVGGERVFQFTLLRYL